MSRIQDLASLLKSLQLITEACARLKAKNIQFIWANSSLRYAAENCKKAPTFQGVSSADIAEGIGRVNTVLQGIKVYTTTTLAQKTELPKIPTVIDVLTELTKPSVLHSQKEKLERKLKENNVVDTQKVDNKEGIVEPELIKLKSPDRVYKLELTENDKLLLKKLDMEHRAKLIKEQNREENKDLRTSGVLNEKEETKLKEKEASGNITAVPNPKSKQKLSDNAKQRKVPSSRIGRMISFGTLAAGLGIGTAAEYAKKTLGIADSTSSDPSMLFLNKANMDRIVDTLCKVRGAALKLGQIMSIQDESIVSPELAKALERVRQSADFMPDWQLEQAMANELGFGWRNNFEVFENTPFAAASIGQVHQATLKDGREVAIKIQYPGVARGIDSDIDNLGGIMKMWNIFPKGMFLENLMVVAKRELAWEVNYIREAAYTKKFKELLRPYDYYYVPDVIDNLSTKQVFTTELLDGVPVDQCFDLDIEHRQFIGDKIMELCLLEILKFRFMQTDPNWANFLYNPNKKQMLLLDFGASREYSKGFIDQYIKILKAAFDDDRQAVLEGSKQLGFLTGYESKIMEEAHVDAVMILGEIFRVKGKYDFAQQDMTGRIQELAQIMIVHRLCPPPEEVYSLHRKLSGIFLLCSKLKVSVACRDIFLKYYNEYLSENRA
ncbi:unnamed protein product [Psylliodes chrysocephalus]|uniref:ABC1 atypical kinase-like domain-containing protein n=1 Tax=Psylliodes chrysocephalus TaxID=3402493 RepID=A0A9P0D2R0_9CUCU|nr:unnamed protein product [Psylliodes chrysocephala]